MNRFRTEIYDPDKHEKYLNDSMDYWFRKGYVKSKKIENEFLFDRYELPLISFYEDQFYLFSALEDTSKWIDNTFRLLTKSLTSNSVHIFVKNHQKLENTFKCIRLHGSLQCEYIKIFKKNNYTPILSMNVSNSDGTGFDESSVRIAKVFNSDKFKSPLFKERIRNEIIWYVDQYVYEFNSEYLIDCGIELYGKDNFHNFFDKGMAYTQTDFNW